MEKIEPTKHQRYTIERVLRSSIIEHPKNPRRITDAAKKKLRDKMKDVGLLQPPIVNRTTGYLLSGHQRIATLDSLERYKPGKNDYTLDVSVVELDGKAEASMLVFLNNASAMGTWDTDALGELATTDTTFDDMGFDRVDVEMLFDGDARFDGMFEDSLQTVEDKGAIASIKEENRKTGRQSGLDSFEQQKDNPVDLSADFYCTVICKDRAEKHALMKHLGIPRGEMYISPSEIFALKR